MYSFLVGGREVELYIEGKLGSLGKGGYSF